MQRKLSRRDLQTSIEKMLSQIFWHQKKSNSPQGSYHLSLLTQLQKKTYRGNSVNIIIHPLDVREMALRAIFTKNKVKLDHSSLRGTFTSDFEQYLRVSQESQSVLLKTTCSRSKSSYTKTRTEALTKLHFSTSQWQNGIKVNFLAKSTNQTFSLMNAVREENWTLQVITNATEYPSLLPAKNNQQFYFAKNNRIHHRNRTKQNKTKLYSKKE